VVQIESITSGEGWFFDSPTPSSLAAASPVAFFALVSATDTEKPLLGASRIVIALSPLDLGDGLVGQEITDKMRSVIHRNELA
jgi:hypothetical protein